MSEKKKLVLSIAVFLIATIVVVMVFLYVTFASFFGEAVPDDVVKDYVEEKYGFEIDIIEENVAGIGAPTEFTVSPQENKDIRFKVTVSFSDHNEIEDDYGLALLADEEYQKLKKVIPAIEELGFAGAENTDIQIYYINDSVYLFLESEKAINYKTFVQEDLDRYYELYELIKKSQANIENVSVGNLSTHTNTDSIISFDLGEPAQVKDKEEFLIELKTTHKEIVEHEMENQLTREVNAIKNERFHLGSQYADSGSEPSNSWLVCTEVDENAECTSAIVLVTYQENSFNLSSPYFKEDLTSIFKFIETHLEPKIKVENIYFPGSNLSGEELKIGYEERIKYKNIDELILFLLEEQ